MRFLLATFLSLSAGSAAAPAAATAPAHLTPTDWKDIRAAYEAHRHAVVPVADMFLARNAGQGWVTRFDGRGFVTRPDEGGWTWGLELVRCGDAQTGFTPRAAATVSTDGTRITYAWNPTLEEWWINDARGLEHGYTLLERPPLSGVEPLTLTLAPRGALRVRVHDDGRGLSFSDESGKEVLSYAGLCVFDADQCAVNAHFEACDSDVRLVIDDSRARYPLTVDPVAQRAYFKASNTDAGDGFGAAVSISGHTVVIGAPAERSAATGVNGIAADNSLNGAGAAYVFMRNGTTWSQQAYLKASNTGANDHFGAAVAISVNTIVVGAPGESSAAMGMNGYAADNSSPQSGAAYVFVRQGTNWVQQAYVKASNTGAGDNFGASVTASIDTFAVGAPGEDCHTTGVNGDEGDESMPESGAVYVFTRTGAQWTERAYLKASNTGTEDRFGTSIALSLDALVVGAPHESSSTTVPDGNGIDDSASHAGAAYVFVRQSGVWVQNAYLKAPNANALDVFGSAVGIAQLPPTSLEEPFPSGWGSEGVDPASGPGSSAGSDVSAARLVVVIGAPREASAANIVNGDQADNSTAGAGAAYVFARANSAWALQAYLKASNSGADDEFGRSVSIAESGDMLVVGAPNEDGDGDFPNADAVNESAAQAGAIYCFTRSATNWSQHAYVKAANSDSDDRFGTSVSASFDTFVVGAPGEASSAIGLNGNAHDDSATDAGAAYEFVVRPHVDATSFCAGDGSGTACPCANPGVPGSGCANSLATGGARLTASGTAGVAMATDTSVLTAIGVVGPALFLQGTNQAQSGLGFTFGDGLLCVGGAISRLGVAFPVNGTASYPSGAGTLALFPSLGASLQAGDVRHYQCWYRDAQSFCTSAGFNLTQGLTISFGP